MEREEAIRRIKAWNLDPDDMEVLAVIAPELKENENERIRMALIKLMTVAGENYVRSATGFEKEQLIAYLEKQQERNVVPSRETILGICWKEDPEEREGLTKLQYIQKYWPGGTINGEPIPTENQSVNIPLAELSEEDESELQNAIDALEFLGKKGVYKSESGYDAALQAASWLKSLPEKFNLKAK